MIGQKAGHGKEEADEFSPASSNPKHMHFQNMYSPENQLLQIMQKKLCCMGLHKEAGFVELDLD